MMLRFLLSFIITFLSFSKVTNADFNLMPISYPYGITGIKEPYIIWQDIYNERDRKSNIRYRITFKTDSEQEIKPIIIKPDIYYQSYYVFRSPLPLEENRYTYTIERLLNNKPVNSRYFYYLKYPIEREFTISLADRSALDDLAPEYLIQYLYIERNNRYINGYNFLFFGTSSIITFGIGMLFYSVIDFGVVSTTISIISFTASSFGLATTVYYGYKYLNKRKKLKKIIEIGKSISINGNISRKSIDAEIELSF